MTNFSPERNLNPWSRPLLLYTASLVWLQRTFVGTRDVFPERLVCAFFFSDKRLCDVVWWMKVPCCPLIGPMGSVSFTVKVADRREHVVPSKSFFCMVGDRLQ